MIQNDTIKSEPAGSRPLPKWLTDQKEGLTLYKPREIVIKKDHSLEVSFALTALMVLLSVFIVTLRIRRKKKKKLYE